jgi:hypothetical protein
MNSTITTGYIDEVIDNLECALHRIHTRGYTPSRLAIRMLRFERRFTLNDEERADYREHAGLLREIAQTILRTKEMLAAADVLEKLAATPA